APPPVSTRFPQVRRSDIVTSSTHHLAPPPPPPAPPPPALARWIAAHTRAGVSGLSMWETPRGASASHTAFTSVGTEAIVPVSPTPLTPSGFTGDGVTVWAVSTFGICDAFAPA